MRVLSGVQPTGSPHLGNYLGAFVNWLQLQNDGKDCFFFVANQHAITLQQDPIKLKQQTLELCAIFLAIGLDPNKSTLFVQSDVPGHAQLSWILSCLAPIGQMERMIQFKEKSKREEDATLGLFSYPVLQSADILLYKANLVPVGVDQAQHLELTRDLARKFNNRYKEIFPEPQTLHTKITKVVGLDGKSKMSKSQNNHISIIEEKDEIWKKLAPAVTDPARIKRSDPGNPEICNIYSLHKLFSTQEDIAWVEDGCKNAKIGCIECKKKLFERIEEKIAPIRESYKEWMAKPDEVKEIFAQGAKKANTVAQETLNEVHKLIGF